MPSPRLIVNRITPTALYFIGLDGFGRGFTDSLGCLFEEYVNAQLGLLNHADIRREISYYSPIKKTVDFFVVTPEVVLLVEVKASRPTQDTRFGSPDGDTDVRKKIGKVMAITRSPPGRYATSFHPPETGTAPTVTASPPTGRCPHYHPYSHSTNRTGKRPLTRPAAKPHAAAASDSDRYLPDCSTGSPPGWTVSEG